jgi:hypothetical protein
MVIEDRQGKGWTFTYLGADANAWNAASSIGITRDNTVLWNLNNSAGTLKAASVMTSSYYTNMANNVSVNNGDMYRSAGVTNFSALAEELK